jgi:predicted transcriptional regulator
MIATPIELGDLERAVLEHVWAVGRADAKAVHRALGRRRRITLNTIQSTLKRLFEKGLLVRDKISHAHVYAPGLSKEQFRLNALERVVERVLDGEAGAMVSAFVDLAERAGEEHLAELERLIAERRRARSRSGT